MIRLVFQALLLLLCVVIEFGFLHALPAPWSLIPLCLPVAVYFVFQLRPALGLAWFVGIGLAADLHASSAIGTTLIGAVLGCGLVYVVQQHISHSSLYSVVSSTGLTVFAWGVLVQVLQGVGGTVSGLTMLDQLIAAGFGMLLATAFVFLGPWLAKYIRFSIRLPNAA